MEIVRLRNKFKVYLPTGGVKHFKSYAEAENFIAQELGLSDDVFDHEIEEEDLQQFLADNEDAVQE
jgi:hypothetical protein